ncbi:hypothetical protein J6590_000222 [Homalodisca vitripennis]|nr:hypothetical protein J6590_000222 [Homalodisca vitripennis]
MHPHTQERRGLRLSPAPAFFRAASIIKQFSNILKSRGCGDQKTSITLSVIRGRDTVALPRYTAQVAEIITAIAADAARAGPGLAMVVSITGPMPETAHPPLAAGTLQTAGLDGTRSRQLNTSCRQISTTVANFTNTVSSYLRHVGKANNNLLLLTSSVDSPSEFAWLKEGIEYEEDMEKGKVKISHKAPCFLLQKHEYASRVRPGRVPHECCLSPVHVPLTTVSGL